MINITELVCLCFKVPERMRCVLQAALDLSTSTKPFDSVTAAHLLNLLLHQPDLSQALLHCAQDQGLSFQLPPPPAQLRCLQSEVSRAESSLLQAAASFPLYGRANCITAALQHLNTEWAQESPYTVCLLSALLLDICSWISATIFVVFSLLFCACGFRSLSQAEQWRRLVPELIAVCYRMSDVVSPVVQSSSPEGLIPMDTDTGNLILIHCLQCNEQNIPYQQDVKAS